jgi:hypothetical protein
MKPISLALGLAATVVLALTASAPAKARPVPNCDTKRHVTTITFRNGHRVKHYARYLTAAASAKVRVYSTVGDDFLSVYYTCWYETGRSHRLAGNTSGAGVYDAYVKDVQIQGRYLAYTYSASGDEPDNYDRFAVVDAAKGRVVRDIKVRQPEGERPAPMLVLTSSGAIAYESGGVLRAADAHGDRLLAMATAQAPITDLVASGHIAYWTQGGVAHSTALD